MALGDQVPRFAHGSRVPGWDDAVDPAKDPAPVPDPASVDVPDELRAEIEGHMAKYPDRRSATIPALAAAQPFRAAAGHGHHAQLLPLHHDQRVDGDG